MFRREIRIYSKVVYVLRTFAAVKLMAYKCVGGFPLTKTLLLMKHLLTHLSVLLLCVGMQAQVIYNADFSTEGDGVPDHTMSNPPASAPAVFSGGTAPNNWTVGYTSTPGTDGSANEFSVNSGVLRVQDFGGTGTFASAVIDVSGVATLDITALGEVIGSDVQNGGSEFFEYYYSIDGGAPVTTPKNVNNAGDDLNYAVVGLDVSSASTLVVGFSCNVNGGGDGYEISSFLVNATLLPVNLTTFTATAQSASVLVQWQTAKEVDNDYFRVERSLDGETFETIGMVQGNGTTDATTDYRFVDEAPATGINYYRLTQTDYDGTSETFAVRSVTMGGAATVDVFPNPVLDAATVRFGQELTDAELLLFDVRGVLLQRLPASGYQTTLDLSGLPSGAYFLQTRTATTLHSQRLLKR